MNREQVRTRVQRFLGETRLKTWTPDDLNQFINDALEELSGFGLLDSGEAQTVTADGTATATLPSDLIRLIGARIGDYDYRPVRPSYRAYFNYDPYKFVVDETAWTAEFYTAPTSGETIYFLGKTRHPELADDDTEIQFAPSYNNAIVFYATALCKLKVQEDAQAFLAMYDREMRGRGHEYKIGQRVTYYDVMQKTMDNL